MVQATARIDIEPQGSGRPPLGELLERGCAFESYTYSYPHKTAYRPFSPRPLERIWQGERRDSLFLYFHVPFCEMRCGYCNLFTQVRAPADLEARYLDTIERQAAAITNALGDLRFARVAFGGGTPTRLSLPLLERLFDVAEQRFGASLSALPVSLETSPTTSTTDKLAALAARGINRISIGVESFVDDELRALGRPLQARASIEALDRIRSHEFATLNIDLIYGIAGQTAASWQTSLETALRWKPEEIYLYPLYVRPLTGLGKKQRSWQDIRTPLYRAGRAFLLTAGYEQVSMRMFRRHNATAPNGPVYCCQEDGLIGLGCGARSYTRGLHYSDEWAVGAAGVREILARWVGRPERNFATAWYGFDLDGCDQRVRYVVKSLLHHDGLTLADYRRTFGSD
ncbi:MAG: STM4012 family radical SAM protein, partial [Myxococcota bacterium]